MSYDFAFWYTDEPLENEEAGEIYLALAEEGGHQRVEPSPKIALLAQEIARLWPDRPGHEDDWPLAAPPDVSESHVILCIVPSRLWDVWPVVGKFAQDHELTMYDPQQQNVFLPRRLSRKRTRVRAKRKRQGDAKG
jgi:hypothetical protein